MKTTSINITQNYMALATAFNKFADQLNEAINTDCYAKQEKELLHQITDQMCELSKSLNQIANLIANYKKIETVNIAKLYDYQKN